MPRFVSNTLEALNISKGFKVAIIHSFAYNTNLENLPNDIEVLIIRKLLGKSDRYVGDCCPDYFEAMQGKADFVQNLPYSLKYIHIHSSNIPIENIRVPYGCTVNIYEGLYSHRVLEEKNIPDDEVESYGQRDYKNTALRRIKEWKEIQTKPKKMGYKNNQILHIARLDGRIKSQLTMDGEDVHYTHQELIDYVREHTVIRKMKKNISLDGCIPENRTRLMKFFEMLHQNPDTSIKSVREVVRKMKINY
jgi:hypothetical protein